MSDAPESTPQSESNYHTYTTHRIPWWIRGIWIGFWVYAIGYFIVNLIPAAKYYF